MLGMHCMETETELSDKGSKLKRSSQVHRNSKKLWREKHPMREIGKKLAMFAASNVFGDPFVNSFLPSLSKMKANKNVTTRSNIALAASEDMHLLGQVLVLDSSKNLMLLCEKGSMALKGSVECEKNGLSIISFNFKLSGTLNSQNVHIKAINSLKVARKADLNSQGAVFLKVGKLGKGEQKEVEKEEKPDSKLRRFGSNVKDMFADWSGIHIRGKIDCVDLTLKGKVVTFAIAKSIRAHRSVNINCWFFANLLGVIRCSHMRLDVQLLGVNLGAIFTRKALAVTSFCFVNLAFLHAPMLTINSIVSLLLLGVTMSFSRFIKAIINVELFAAGLPTLPTKELLKNPAHLINALLMTLQQLIPGPVRACVMMAQSGFILLGLFKTFFTLVVKLKAMVESMKENGIHDMPVQLTDIVSIVADCVSAWTIFNVAVGQITQASQMNSITGETLQQIELDLETSAMTLAGNIFLPTMSEISVISESRGARVAYAITDKGVYGHFGGASIAAGHYMADFVQTYTNQGFLYSCGDIIVSSRYVEATGQTASRQNVNFQAEKLLASNIIAFGDFQAMATGGIELDNVNATKAVTEAELGISLSEAEVKDIVLLKSGGSFVNVAKTRAGAVFLDSADHAVMDHVAASSLQANAGSSVTGFFLDVDDNLAIRGNENINLANVQGGNVHVVANKGDATVMNADVSGTFDLSAGNNTKIEGSSAKGNINVVSVKGDLAMSGVTTDGAVTAAAKGQTLVSDVSSKRTLTVISEEQDAHVSNIKGENVLLMAKRNVDLDGASGHSFHIQAKAISAKSAAAKADFVSIAEESSNIEGANVAGDLQSVVSDGSASISQTVVQRNVVLSTSGNASIENTSASEITLISTNADVTSSKADRMLIQAENHALLEDSEANQVVMKVYSATANRNVVSEMMVIDGQSDVDVNDLKTDEAAFLSKGGQVHVQKLQATAKLAVEGMEVLVSNSSADGTVHAKSQNATEICNVTAAKDIVAQTTHGSAVVKGSGAIGTVNVEAFHSAVLEQSHAENAFVKGNNVVASNNTVSDTFIAEANANAMVNHLTTGQADVKAGETAAVSHIAATKGGIAVSGKTQANVDSVSQAEFLHVRADQQVNVHDVNASGTVSALTKQGFTHVNDIKAAKLVAEGGDATVKNIESDKMQVIGNTTKVEGSMNVEHAYVKGNVVSLQHLGNQVFGKLEIRAEQRIENLYSILNRAGVYRNLNITQALNLETPNQNLVLDQLLRLSHELSVDAKSIAVGKDGGVITDQGNLSLRSHKGSMSLEKATIEARNGHVQVSVDNGGIDVTASIISGEKGVSLKARDDINVQANVERVGDRKDYERSVIQGGQGTAYEALENGETVDRKLGVSIVSQKGNVYVKTSDVKAGGDVSIEANKSVELDADSYMYEASRKTSGNWFHKKETVRYDTHVEGTNVESGGFVSIKAGQNLTATSAEILSKDGFLVVGDEGVKIQHIVKDSIEKTDRKLFGGIFGTSSSTHTDRSQRALNVVQASDPNSRGVISSGGSVDISGAAISSGKQGLFLEAKSDIDLTGVVAASTGSVDMKATEGSMSLEKATIEARNGHVQVSVDNGGIDVTASIISGEKGVSLKARDDINVQANVERVGDRKDYERSVIQGGQGTAYEALENGETVDRKLGVSIVSQKGNVYVKTSDVKAGGDVSIEANKSVELDADSYMYEASRKTSGNWFHKKETVRYDTHVEGTNVESGGFVSIKAGQNLTATSAEILSKDGFLVVGDEGVKIQHIVKDSIEKTDRKLFGGIFGTSSSTHTDRSQRALNVVQASDPNSRGVISSGGSVDISGAAISSGKQGLFLEAKSDIDLTGVVAASTGSVDMKATEGSVRIKAEQFEDSTATMNTGHFVDGAVENFGVYGFLANETKEQTDTGFHSTAIIANNVNIQAGKDFRSQGSAITTRSGVDIAAKGQVMIEDSVGKSSTNETMLVAGGIISGRVLDEDMETSTPSVISASNPDGKVTIQSGEGISFVGSSVKAENAVFVAPTVTHRERILNHNKTVESWGFFVSNPMSDFVMSPKNILNPLNGVRNVLDGVRSGNPQFSQVHSGITETAVQVQQHAALIEEVVSVLSDNDSGENGKPETPHLNRMKGQLSNVSVGYKYEHSKESNQFVAGKSGIDVNNLVVKAEKFSVLDGAILNSKYAHFDVRDIVVSGADLQNSSETIGINVSAGVDVSTGEVGAVGFEVSGGVTGGNKFQNAQVNVGKAHFENVDGLKVTNGHLQFGEAGGKIGKVELESQLGKQHSSNVTVGASVNLATGVVIPKFGMGVSDSGTINQQTGITFGQGGSQNLHIGNLDAEGAFVKNESSTKTFTVDKITTADVHEHESSFQMQTQFPGVNMGEDKSATDSGSVSFGLSVSHKAGIARATIGNADGSAVKVFNSDGHSVDLNGANSDLAKAHEVTGGFGFGMSGKLSYEAAPKPSQNSTAEASETFNFAGSMNFQNENIELNTMVQLMETNAESVFQRHEMQGALLYRIDEIQTATAILA